MDLTLLLAFCFVLICGLNASESGDDLPECPYHDPIKQAEDWRHYHKTTACKITIFKPEEETDEDRRYQYGSEKYSFNVYVSDKIGPHRKIPVTYHKE